MATFVRIPDPDTDPKLLIPPLHLGKRLLRARQRHGIPLEGAAIALETDNHTVTAIEAGDSIPPRLSGRLRTYLHQLENRPAPASAAPPLPVGEAQGEGPATDADETVAADRHDDPPAPQEKLSFGPWVLQERLKRGWSGRDLARRAGIAPGHMNRIERGGADALRPETRAKIEAALAGGPYAPPAPPPASPLLDADTSAVLRVRMIRAMLDRKLNQHELAQALGLKRTVVQRIIKSPDGLLPQDLADKITMWLNQRHDERETMSDEGENDFVASSSIVQPSSFPSVEPSSTPAPHGDAPADDEDSAAADQAEGDPGEADDLPDPAPEERPTPRMFNSFQFHLPRPASRDVALLALLDKFPDFEDAHGCQSYWFQCFIKLAELALTPAESK